MPSIEVLIAFALTTMIFAFIPGPAMLYTAAQTLARGRRAGLMATLGVHLGGYFHVAAVTLGLSALLAAVPVFYLVVKLAGAAYLVYLGIRLFKAEDRNGAMAAFGAGSSRRAFVESITVEVMNPKTALFFLAFLPQFTDPAAALPISIQLLVLGAIVNLAFTSADLTCVVLAGWISARIKRSGAFQRIVRKIAGGILVGLGINLALQRI